MQCYLYITGPCITKLWGVHIFIASSYCVLLVFNTTGYASQHIWCLSQARINWEGCVRKGIRRKNGGDGRDGIPISLDGVAVHLDCWYVCLCYLHFAPENPEDGKMHLLVPAHPVPDKVHRAVKWLCCVCVILILWYTDVVTAWRQ